MIHAISFDMDGVLASSEDVYEQVGTETLRRRGKTFDDDLRHAMLGLMPMVALQKMIDWHDLDDDVHQLALESEQLFWEMAEGQLHPMPGVPEMFDRIDELGLPRGVVTSGMGDYAERILTIIGIRDRLDFVITADDVVHGKPNPEPYLMGAERHGVDPTNMLVFEDSSHGCQAAIAAGAYTIAVPSRHTQSHDFTGARFVADTLRDERIAGVLSDLARPTGR